MVTALTRFILTTTVAAAALAGLASEAEAQNFGHWQTPVSIDPMRSNGVNTSVNDGCPIEAPDGEVLFFASDRSVPNDFDIWIASRTETGKWGDAERLPYPVNVTGQQATDPRDFCPTPLPGNRLLFVSGRANNCGTGNNADIYYTQLHPVKGWLPPVALPCGVNSGFEEFSPSFVEAEGKTLLYFSSNRGDGVRQKIYVTELQSDGSWSEAAEVVELSFPGAQDARPNVRKDGLEIVFDSTRVTGNAEIWTATRASVWDSWSHLHQVEVTSSPGQETRATISRDGTRLYFGTTRDNVAGDRGADMYMSTRSGPGKK